MKTTALALATLVTAGFSVPVGWSMCVTSLVTGVCGCCAAPDTSSDDPPRSCCQKDEESRENVQAHTETGGCSCNFSVPEDGRYVDAAQLSDVTIIHAAAPQFGGPAEFFAAEAAQATFSPGLREPPPTSPFLSLLCVMIC
jgi:hypothetical protein